MGKKKWAGICMDTDSPRTAPELILEHSRFKIFHGGHALDPLEGRAHYVMARPVSILVLRP